MAADPLDEGHVEHRFDLRRPVQKPQPFGRRRRRDRAAKKEAIEDNRGFRFVEAHLGPVVVSKRPAVGRRPVRQRHPRRPPAAAAQVLEGVEGNRDREVVKLVGARHARCQDAEDQRGVVFVDAQRQRRTAVEQRQVAHDGLKRGADIGLGAREAPDEPKPRQAAALANDEDRNGRSRSPPRMRRAAGRPRGSP